ncbi:MAG: hypothetical protein NVSMB29_11140 [Candidatus Dormibacteria bacterium]
MNAAVLYCRSGCAACASLARRLADGGVDAEVHDVATDAGALDAVVRLGHLSLPVLVGPDGSSAAGAKATTLARQLAGAPTPAPSHLPHHTINAKESR